MWKDLIVREAVIVCFPKPKLFEVVKPWWEANLQELKRLVPKSAETVLVAEHQHCQQLFGRDGIRLCCIRSQLEDAVIRDMPSDTWET